MKVTYLQSTSVLITIWILFFVGPICCQDCGKLSRNILSVEDFQQGLLPWMVKFTKKNSSGVQIPWCSGFLIDKKNVVTSAHCFTENETRAYEARIGDLDLTEKGVYGLDRIILHPEYVFGVIYDDIAVVTLSREADIPNFNPVCLRPSLEYPNMTGMGAVAASLDERYQGGSIRLINIRIISNYDCNRTLSLIMGKGFAWYFPRGITSGFICTALVESGIDNCEGMIKGASGGPVMLLEEKFDAVGVITFGGNCRSLVPNVHIRISEYLDWINNNKT